MNTRIAVAHVIDSRTDFYELRRPLVEEEKRKLDWLRGEFQLIESDVIDCEEKAGNFAGEVQRCGAAGLIVHIPIWADPIFAVRMARRTMLPMLLLGNTRPDTSSMVGLLGAGGGLDQVGVRHVRVFDHSVPEGRRQALAFGRAAGVLAGLRGQTCGLIGGRALGIFTTVADPAQWFKIFGVDLQYIDQQAIVTVGEALEQELVERHVLWLMNRLGGVQFAGAFTLKNLERQVRSYLATRRLAEENSFDFVGVKCQPEMSDGYVTQCVAHMLSNGMEDADGPKDVLVHACEADADGALTMQILHELSGGKPAALLDVRWYNPQQDTWVLANCGAAPASFYASPGDPSGLSNACGCPHVFGHGGGGAFPAVFAPQQVTMARLCRRDGGYWMAILPGEVGAAVNGELEAITPAFPKAVVHCKAGADFLNEFGSNHVHMVSGDYTEELVQFCRLAGIPWKIWS